MDGAAAVPKFTVDQVMELYQKTKGEIEALAKVQGEAMAPLAARLELTKAWLLKYLNDQKLENARTAHGLAYKSNIMSATVDPDGGWEKLLSYILEAVMARALDAIEAGATDEIAIAACLTDPVLALLNRAVNKTAVKELLEQEILVPGVKIAHLVQLGVRKA